MTIANKLKETIAAYTRKPSDKLAKQYAELKVADELEQLAQQEKSRQAEIDRITGLADELQQLKNDHETNQNKRSAVVDQRQKLADQDRELERQIYDLDAKSSVIRKNLTELRTFIADNGIDFEDPATIEAAAERLLNN